MDIPRPTSSRKKTLRRGLFFAAVVAVLALTTLGLSRLKPAAPRVEKAGVWIDTVKRGDMRREVRGPGALVPEEVRWVPAATDGRVERLLAQPGAAVKADQVVLELSNPDVARAASEAVWQVKAAEAEYTDLKVRLESQLLNQQAAAASIEADYKQARLQLDVNTELAKEGLLSALTLKLAQVRLEELGTRKDIEQKRVRITSESNRAQLAVQTAHLAQLQALSDFRQQQKESLTVRAGIDGVLQQLPVEVGQQVTPGATLAKIARPDKLKAVLRIPQTQARDLLLGQEASIDTHNGLIPGRVTRIDPAVQHDSVSIDVAMTGPLPKGARPDLSVDGTILIEQLEGILYVGRPASGQADSAIQLFKLDAQSGAVRVPVKLGRTSVNTVEIVTGLKEGDQVILSDSSRWDGSDRIELD